MNVFRKNDNKNKDRLYVVLSKYGGKGTMPHGGDKYRWFCMIGPKNEEPSSEGTKIYIQRVYQSAIGRRWSCRIEEATMAQGEMRLIRLRLCKIKDVDRLLKAARSVGPDQISPDFNSAVFVERVIVAIAQANKKAGGEILGAGCMDWDSIRDMAMGYVRMKEAMHRFDGTVPFDFEKTPTYDMIEGKETQE